MGLPAAVLPTATTEQGAILNVSAPPSLPVRRLRAWLAARQAPLLRRDRAIRGLAKTEKKQRPDAGGAAEIFRFFSPEFVALAGRWARARAAGGMDGSKPWSQVAIVLR
jgi:hypothetical protein